MLTLLPSQCWRDDVSSSSSIWNRCRRGWHSSKQSPLAPCHTLQNNNCGRMLFPLITKASVQGETSSAVAPDKSAPSVWTCLSKWILIYVWKNRDNLTGIHLLEEKFRWIDLISYKFLLNCRFPYNNPYNKH